MYTVVVVEDEPVALKHICLMIESHCKSFKVIGTASNGKEALDTIKQVRPQLVIADIRMPIMDGLELSKVIFEKYPETFTVIVSGYQDFEYARQAIKNQVLDYMLKPISPTSIKKTLELVKKHMDNSYDMRKRALFRRIVQQRSVESWELDWYFSAAYYRIALVRNGGLPRRFTANFLSDVFSDNSSSIIVYGRDEQENLYIYPADIFTESEFRAVIKKQSEYLPIGYKTMLFSKELLSKQKLTDAIKTIYQSLNKNIILGQSQTVVLQNNKLISGSSKIVTSQTFQILEHYIHSKNLAKIKDTVQKLLSDWSNRDIPIFILEKAVMQIFNYIILQIEDLPQIDIDSLLEDAFFFAEDYVQLDRSISEILDRIFCDDSAQYSKVDTPEFFDKVTGYIQNTIETPHTLASVCSVFHISQTYLSRLFRKYTDYTFNEYLTKVRIDRAKTLLLDNPDMLIQDIATIVGYKDQFYFSRIFKNYTGIPPTEYSTVKICQ